MKPTYRKSWASNLQPRSLYYCFYRFAMFGDTPPARNKVSSIILVLYILTISLAE